MSYYILQFVFDLKYVHDRVSNANSGNLLCNIVVRIQHSVFADLVYGTKSVHVFCYRSSEALFLFPCG